ncbi:MAG TPA: N-6 DNA methylase [Planctomycetes bacterium]|nr:N-6 DNA methylase [Planctomycetota bacterium]
MLKTYMNEIFKVAQRGDAREESYYNTLSTLMGSFAQSINRSKTEVTVQPKRTEAGNPDFRIWDGRQHIVGYIEAKPPTEENLDKIAESQQLKRYLNSFANVILTNFFEFRLYRNGALTDKVQIGRRFIAGQLKTVPPVENEEKFLSLLDKFFSFSLPRTYTPKTLAQALAKRTHYLREQVLFALDGGTGDPAGFYEAFREHLIAALKKEDFADIYAQTITYGLFAASTRCKGEFNRKLAFDNIPRTIGILRDVFRFVSLEEPGDELVWIIDDIADILAAADVKQILHKYFVEGKGKDPVVHFYETFLAQYDPKEREQRGVYYTPQEVVSYIVNSLNTILKDYFDKPDGLATGSITVLDPGAGTLTFLAEAASVGVQEFADKYGRGGTSELIKNHILKNFYAFELMMAPYAIGHLKMGFLLEEFGYTLDRDDRFKLYLTNTLDMKELAESNLPGTSSLSRESHAAGEIKKQKPILVILGNPPYSGHSANTGPWISREIKEYYKVDGKDLGEKNPKWLQDDYVKFIRFAQWKIDQAGEGVLGFITNHSYLDNPTFRGMRWSLMNSFNHIYVLDLHGNSKKREKCPDGSKDENVFDIQQGVAIILAVKKKGLKKKVSHSDLWGLRQQKYDWLGRHYVKNTKWKKLTPEKDFYFFVRRDGKLLAGYEKYTKITDIFGTNSVGVVTSRDKLVIACEKAELSKRLRMFRDESIPDGMIKKAFDLKENPRWKLKDARKKVRQEDKWEKQVTDILYRPFDSRWIFYNDAVIERRRREVMRHMMQENLSMITSRIVKGESFRHCWVSKTISSAAVLAPNTASSSYVFPLYTYPDVDLFNGAERYQRQVNINPSVFETLQKTYGKKIKAETLFYYIYAVLYSPAYRTKYGEFLKSDFPRIPVCRDFSVFRLMSRQGNNLVELHLMTSRKLDKPVAKFEGKGNNLVEKISYDAGKKAVYINEGRYFVPVKPDMWEYRIGGYQVLDKWLKSRKGRRLSLADIKHYCRIVTAVRETENIQKKLDKIYPDIEKKCISFEKSL